MVVNVSAGLRSRKMVTQCNSKLYMFESLLFALILRTAGEVVSPMVGDDAGRGFYIFKC